MGAQAVPHALDGGEVVGADAVHLVDEADSRHPELVGLAPDGLGLRLDTGNGVEHSNGPVEDSKGPFDLYREVNVAGGVDDVDYMVFPLGGGGGRGDGDATLLLLDHPVHDGGAVVNLSDFVGAAGVEKDALGCSGLARVDVRHDPDVPGTAERDLANCGDLLFRLNRFFFIHNLVIHFFAHTAIFPGTSPASRCIF